MKIAFIWYWNRASEIYPNWRDGLRAAMEEIEKQGHQVSWFFDQTTPDPDDDYDFILLWDDSDSDFFKQIDNFKCRKGLCLTTDPHNFDNLRKLDVVYCESTPVLEQVKREGIRAIKAFGTDTDFFKPDPKIKKDIEYFYPATFSPWKRQSKISYLGSNLLCVGTIQLDGVEEYNTCMEDGVRVEVGYFPSEKIRDYYQRTKEIIIPAVHGSERTVLEAMACDIVPEVTHRSNIKTSSYLFEYGNALIGEFGERVSSPREFVLKNYSHRIYAQNLLKGMQL